MKPKTIPTPAQMRRKSVRTMLGSGLKHMKLYGLVVNAVAKSDGRSDQQVTVNGCLTYEYADVIVPYYKEFFDEAKTVKAWLQDNHYQADVFPVAGSSVGFRVCWDMQVTAVMMGLRLNAARHVMKPCQWCEARDSVTCRPERCALMDAYKELADEQEGRAHDIQ